MLCSLINNVKTHSHVMTKNHALSRLLRRIKEEEQRTRRYAVRVRISRSVGLDIAAMDAANWHDASNGWTEMDQCKKLASDFLKEGEAAVQGLRLSVAGPTKHPCSKE